MHTAVEIDECYGGVTCVAVPCLDVGAGRGRDDCEYHPHSGHTCQHEGPAADTRREEGERKGTCETEHLRCCSDQCCLDLLGDTCAFEHANVYHAVLALFPKFCGQLFGETNLPR